MKNENKNSIDNLSNKQKLKIYEDIRNFKIKQNKLIVLDGIDIDISRENKSIYTKIRNIFFSSEVETEYKGIYFGFGNQAKFIDIPIIKNKTTTVNKTKLFNIFETKKEKQFYMNGMTLLFFDYKSIFTPSFDTDKKEFIYNISPEYYWKLNNEVFDINMTKPISEGILTKFTWKKILIVVIIIGIFLYMEYVKKTGQG